MIVLSATVWPLGNQAQSYEVLNVTLTNESPPHSETENYYAHVLARPAQFRGLEGYEADVEVRGHQFRDGFPTLLMSVLNAAHSKDGKGLILPPARQLARLDLVDAHQFEELLRGRPGQ